MNYETFVKIGLLLKSISTSEIVIFLYKMLISAKLESGYVICIYCKLFWLRYNCAQFCYQRVFTVDFVNREGANSFPLQYRSIHQKTYPQKVKKEFQKEIQYILSYSYQLIYVSFTPLHFIKGNYVIYVSLF